VAKVILGRDEIGSEWRTVEDIEAGYWSCPPETMDAVEVWLAFHGVPV
jgi:hypothetical protein